MTGRFLTISNVLSLSRVVLVALFAVIVLADPSAKLWGLGVLVLAMITDKLDGDIARRLGQESTWGRILDPLADKVGVAVVAVILLILELVPVWFLAILVVRDLLILSGGLLLRAQAGVVLPSNVAGKWTVTVIAATLLLAFLEAPPAVQFAAQLGATLMAAVSLALYARTYARVRQQQGPVA